MSPHELAFLFQRPGIEDWTLPNQNPNLEFSVLLKEGQNPGLLSVEAKNELSDDALGQYDLVVSGNKLGGTPCFIQNPSYPIADGDLLLQLEATDLPFLFCAGDSGIGYIFINKERTLAKFMSQGY